jgi:hypothetical protein
VNVELENHWRILIAKDILLPETKKELFLVKTAPL